MDTPAKLAAALVLVASCALSAAEKVDGSWSAVVKHDGSEIRYEVDLALHHKRAYGRWTVETNRPSTGCFIGAVVSSAVNFRTCTTDGSVGARDMKALCPEYHKGQNRFVPNRDKLAWETWDDGRRSWRKLVLLERAKQERPVSWSEEECGKR